MQLLYNNSHSDYCKVHDCIRVRIKDQLHACDCLDGYGKAGLYVCLFQL